MAHILVIGGGLSGCAAALELAAGGQDVIIIEKAPRIGGKVFEFGCKASEGCNNCGVCLTGGLWESVEHNDRIQVLTDTRITDAAGGKGDFCVAFEGPKGRGLISEISAVIVAIGFERAGGASFSNLQLEGTSNVISGFELEKIMLGRKKESVLPENYSSIAFIQCFGSRDVQEKAFYCSRVCCAYSTRMAKVLKHCYPELKITFFYMDMQYVKQGKYYEEMRQEGIEFIRCRPVMIKGGAPASVFYEHPETGETAEGKFGLVVLSEGIHPPCDAEVVAELFMLGVGEGGFLKYVREGKETGVYLAGCASGPKRIEESYSEAVATAGQLLCELSLQDAKAYTQGKKEEFAL